MPTTRPLRILCITPWFPAYPGAHNGSFILDSLAALASQGNQIRTLVTTPWRPGFAGRFSPEWGFPRIEPQRHDPALGVEVLQHFSLPRNLARPLSRYLLRRRIQTLLPDAVTAFRPDVLLVHTELVAEAVIAASAGLAARLPLVTVIHGINTSPKLNSSAELRRFAATLRKSDRVVLVGEPLWEPMARLAVNTQNFRIVHNGFKQVPVSCVKAGGFTAGPLRLISVSNLVAGKGIDINLAALAQLKATGQTHWTYTIVGDGPERTSLEAEAARLGLQGHIVFKGAVEHSAVYGLLQDADVFLLPSWREAFGIAWLEAMAIGLLAIAVQGQGPAAFIEHDRTGLLVAPQDTGSVVQCLQRIIAEPGVMETLAMQGRQAVLQDFTWDAHASRLGTVCREVVEGAQ